MSIPLSDVVRKFLVDLGYNITRSFYSDVAPLQILDKSSQANVVEVTGDASEIFYHPVAIPEIKKGTTVDISGSSTENLSINVTISFLDDFLKNSIFGKAELTGTFTNVSTFTTKFSSCSGDIVFPLEVTKFLRKSSQGGINENEFVTSRILDNTSYYNPAYIVTETLKAQEITMSAKDENNLIIKPNLEVLKALKFGGEVSWKVTHEGELKLTHIVPMVFAFKAGPVWINNQTIGVAPPVAVLDGNDVEVNEFASGYAFTQPSSLHNPGIVTPVLLSSSGMPIRVGIAKK